MKSSMKNQVINIRPGTIIQGKWHHNQYEIVKQLGHGACGTVYLALFQHKHVALKISRQQASITTEVNVLKALNQVQGARLGPSLMDVDDFVTARGVSFSFYVMENLQGYELNRFIRQKGQEWLGILTLQLLDDLDALHQAGWVFGDLKPENLMVTAPPPRLRWIDVGGTTRIGRAIKEFTEFYDRGYWGLGSRKAEPGYDLFALAMVLIQVSYPKRFDRGADPARTLKTKLRHAPMLQKYVPCIERALFGKYSSSKEMKHDLLNSMTTRSRNVSSTSRRKHVPKQQKKGIHPREKYRILEPIGIGVVLLLFGMVFMMLQSL
ncbi:MAG: protein kinase family protein [Bacillaceae bacterium]|nr:protein kinase family protein [Bacillaceae bacterium]